MNGIELGYEWAKSEAFSDGLLRAIISKGLKSTNNLGLMLNLAQMYPKLIPNLSQLLPKRKNSFFLLLSSKVEISFSEF